MTEKTAAKYGLGIDPGWKNLGLAIVKEDEAGLSLVYSTTLNPSAKSLSGAVNEIRDIVGEKTEFGAHHAAIERFVSYNNVLTAESENILLLIGGLVYQLQNSSTPVDLYRAIDWKTELVKLLVKHRGFDNPSTSLDKKFSIAAAHACLDIKGEFSNDHEADAVAISALAFLKNRYAAKPRAA